MKHLNKYKLYFIPIILVYILTTFLIPPDPSTLERYNISLFTLRLLSLSVTIPIILIWTIAFYGFSKFMSYSDKIKGDKDGSALRKISIGLGILAIGTPIASIISSISRYISRENPGMERIEYMINSYITVLITLLAFIMIYKGAEKLKNIVNAKMDVTKIIIVLTSLTAFLMLYLYIYATDPTHLILGSNIEGNYTSLEFILTVLRSALRVLTWTIGLLSALYISLYKANVPGILYKGALKFLSMGVLAVIFASILTQIISILGLSELPLGQILLLVYGLLAVMSIGYILIAIGSHKLSKIEEL